MIESSDLRMTRISPQLRSWPYPRTRLWHFNSRSSRNDNRHQRRPRSRIPSFRLRGTIRQRARSWHGVAGSTRRGSDRARRHFRHHKAVELQSSARARRTGFRGESRKTRPQVSGSLPHSHSVCISTRGQSGSARSKRQCDLRSRRDFARHLESDGNSRGPRQVPRHRAFGRQFERTATHLRISENQARRGPGRITSVSAGNGAIGILQGHRRCVFGFCTVRPWNAPGAARRSSHFGYRRARWKDAGAGAAGLGGATRHGPAYHAQERSPRQREFRHLSASKGRARRNQSNSNQTATEHSGENRRAGFHSTRETSSHMNTNAKPQLAWSDSVRRQ